MTERIMTDANGRKYITTEPLLHPLAGDIRALKHRIHALEGEIRFAKAELWIKRINKAVEEERKAMMQLFTDPENQPTQHGTVTVEYMQREIAAEREACAKVCEDSVEYAGDTLAEAIRARRRTHD